MGNQREIWITLKEGSREITKQKFRLQSEEFIFQDLGKYNFEVSVNPKEKIFPRKEFFGNRDITVYDYTVIVNEGIVKTATVH